MCTVKYRTTVTPPRLIPPDCEDAETPNPGEPSPARWVLNNDREGLRAGGPTAVTTRATTKNLVL